MVKIATSPAASAGLDRHAELLGWLRPALGAGPSAALLPQVMRRGTYGGERVLVETRLPGAGRHRDDSAGPAAHRGRPGGDHRDPPRHRGHPAIVDRRCWRAGSTSRSATCGGCRPAAATPAALDRLAGALHEALTGREVTGQGRPRRLLVRATCWSRARRGRPGGAPGMVDWENARPVGLPDTDLVHWWLAAQPVELGAAVRQALAASRAGGRRARGAVDHPAQPAAGPRARGAADLAGARRRPAWPGPRRTPSAGVGWPATSSPILQLLRRGRSPIRSGGERAA